METAKLKKFAQFARRSLIEQISAKLTFVLAENSAAHRESAEAVRKLEEAIKGQGKEQVIERVAYIWFNRFCALRFMDVNRYNRVNIVSPADPGQFQPEILAEAKMGHIDEEMVSEKIRQQIFALLNGTVPSRDPQSEAYRLLVVAACNDFHRVMPYLFERIADFIELLMPDDLLSGNSILTYTRETMTWAVCGDVEVIGWLYQFYISEKKDKVFDDLKKNKKITPENIPAATQLFTPHWIVRYLVENSIGRLWLLNRPKSKLIEQMEYYIKPEQTESDFLRINKPDEIKICDPACGSGHMLTYAFDLLYAIYEEEGYEPSEIPEKILSHNLFGIEIDERAGELAAFALTMKARARQRRFFRKPIQPNICVLQNVQFDDVELKNYMDFIGRDLFTTPLQSTLKQFEEADNFGSLIRPEVTDVAAMLKILEAKNVSGQLFLGPTHHKVLQALQQADYLTPKYHVVITNPPYMGSGSMNRSLSVYVQLNYTDSKSDLMACFMEAAWAMLLKNGYIGMINQQSWMFLDYFKSIRARVIENIQIESLLHLGSRTFPEISGEVVQSVAFVFCNKYPSRLTTFFRLVGYENTQAKKTAFLERQNIFIANQLRHDKIPDSPLGYWFSDNAFELFEKFPALSSFADVRAGLQTGNNDAFIRYWAEVSKDKFSAIDPKIEVQQALRKWYPYNKGGTFRKWYGNRDLVVDWENDGQNIKKDKLKRLENGLILPSNSKPKNTQYYFREGITWSTTGGKQASFRLMPNGELFDIKGSSLFPNFDNITELLLAQLNSSVARNVIGVLTPTLDFSPGYIAKIPTDINPPNRERIVLVVCKLIHLSKTDWNSYETSWDFTTLLLLHLDYRQSTLKATYNYLRAHWQSMTQEMQRLEEENNRIFIDAYGLRDELTPEVPLNEITLTCNPHYRYSNSKNAEELETLLLADTMKEFISYAVGCMFGRYALDKPGLILANQGDTISEYLKQIPDPTFPADEDNVIPILDGDWFTDDISQRFRKFLRITFGEEHYEENLKFIEISLGKDIRKFFLKDFYNDHLRRYKKRPIYWLFSSPKGSFNALMYMHRYRSDTASVVLNGYLREFRTKLLSRKSQLEAVSISANATSGQKSEALRKIDRFKTMIAELESYERELLYPIATKQIPIDLDEGVKVNYQKFGLSLKKIHGLDAKED